MAFSKTLPSSFMYILSKCNLESESVIQGLISDISESINAGKVEEIQTELSVLHTLLASEECFGHATANVHDDSLNKNNGICDGKKNTTIGIEMKSMVLDQIVVPILGILPQLQNKSNVRQHAFQLLKSTFRWSSGNSQENVLGFCLNSVELYNKEKLTSFTRGELEHVEGALDILSVLEILHLSLEICSPSLNASLMNNLLKALVKTVSLSGDQVAGYVVGTVLPKILAWDSVNLAEHLDLIKCEIHEQFETFGQKCYQTKTLNPMSERPFLFLCGMADWFFPANGETKFEIKLEKDVNFWRMLQAGFYHVSSLTRKRSVYLLKRILDITETCDKSLNTDWPRGTPVFWWNTESKVELSAVWQDFVLLVETLEEKQVHVIKPVMTRLQQLVKASVKRSSGHPFLHTSWIAVIIQRASGHESVHIKRWAVSEMLRIDMCSCPMMDQGMETFLCGTLVSMLTESAVHYKPSNVPLGKAPPIADYMITFFQSCHDSLPDTRRKEFFLQFIRGLALQNWSGAALVYVMQGLALLQGKPCLDQLVLPEIREVLTSVMSTLEIFFRAAIQCFVAKFLIKLLDMRRVTVGQVMAVLAGLSSEESLQRGTGLWSDLVHWVKVTSTEVSEWSAVKLRDHVKVAMESYLRVIPDTGGSPDLISSQECLPVVRLLLILCDTDLLMDLPQSAGGTTLEELLFPVMEVLQSAGTHVYLPAAKADRALLWLNTLVAEMGVQHGESSDIVKTLRRNCSDCFNSILMYIQRRIVDGFSSVKDVHVIKLYCSVFGQLVRFEPDVLHGSSAMPQLVQMCIRILKADQPNKPSMGIQMERFAAMLLLASLVVVLKDTSASFPKDCKENLLYMFRDRKPVKEFARPADASDGLGLGGRKSDSGDGISWGKVSSDFLAAQWTCLTYLMIHGGQWCPLSTDECVPYMEACLETLDLLTGDGVVPVLQCMAPLIPRVIPEMALHAMHAGWGKVKEVTRSSSFWSTYSAFVKMSYCPVALATCEESNIDRFLIKVAKDIFSLGEEKHGMVLILVSHMCSYYKERDENLGYSHKYKSILLDAVMFGPVHSKPHRFMNEVQSYLVGLRDNLPSNQILKRQAREECLVRVTVLSLLSQLKTSNSTHREFALMFINELMQKHRSMVAEVGHRTFSNSLSHREKHRIVTTLVILEPFMDQTACLDYCLEMLVHEYQPSVRLYCEWLLIRLLFHEPQVIPNVWTALDQASEKKGACLCSLLSVTAHIAKLQEGPQQLDSYARQALPRIVPWCMSHHFNTRTFAQACLVSIWERCRQQGLNELMQDHVIMEAFVGFTSSNSYASKNTQKLQDNFFFTFHPLRDYSIQSIFYTLPNLTMLIDEEWIPPDMFELSDKSWSLDQSESSHNLPLMNPSNDLEKCEPGAWKVKPLGPGYRDKPADGNVQKKMIPWRNMLPEQEFDFDIQEEYSKKHSTAGGLVLVTSLIDKIPNLGGLCRTCEIFGVSEYIIASLKYVQDKTFESLSVTAHKWIPIKEVKPHHLKEYLVEMKQQGYTLVGAEQTANSVCLTKYTFPTKTLLLLGNEKEGIPVELIQLLDVCVEIPQQGIIRSLNVHVSGALLIWEYARQRLKRN